MLVGPIPLYPEQDGYRLKGVTRLGALFESGNAETRVEMASPRGLIDYSGTALIINSAGRLSERAPRRASAAH